MSFFYLGSVLLSIKFCEPLSVTFSERLLFFATTLKLKKNLKTPTFVIVPKFGRGGWWVAVFFQPDPVMLYTEARFS